MINVAIVDDYREDADILSKALKDIETDYKVTFNIFLLDLSLLFNFIL